MSGFGHIKSFGIGVVILGTAEQLTHPLLKVD